MKEIENYIENIVKQEQEFENEIALLITNENSKLKEYEKELSSVYEKEIYQYKKDLEVQFNKEIEDYKINLDEEYKTQYNLFVDQLKKKEEKISIVKKIIKEKILSYGIK